MERHFPVCWAEWNGKYRDAVRHFWRGDQGTVGELASRLSGSSDIYQWTQRGAYASINFVTAHDGFTSHNLVSFERKQRQYAGGGSASAQRGAALAGAREHREARERSCRRPSSDHGSLALLRLRVADES